ncbi:NADH-quinone oxidoreductase subunit G [Gordonia sp. PDNC005]|uniref:NADH-quinone oxidoreductase subunit G n=1 Tax=unclassified Gordonia (in: high G+C Gram-positive bacteria) TaxID=2657482 RepID=UPI001962649A|nr:NADH-quinone oxidoreductase subunit G [Gordonia sp. PDNC005]QRY63717.1 NADH-quinone oxidoreductase subunit G [Gordonia sp. PDNC005]
MSEGQADDQVTVVIDGTPVSVPTGTLVIRAAEMIGVDIPRFCDHPLLAPVGACRQCLVDIEGLRKPMASCTTVVSDGMVVRTQHSSVTAAKAQSGVMELLLINHPLDCPTCDKGGECPLQNQAMSAGRSESRFAGVKRTYTKPVPLSSEVLLDRERCVLCARCTRFADEIAGDPLIALSDRGALQQVSAYREPGAGSDATADAPFDSYFSGNTVQICPVGALTGAAYRFRARPFDLVSSPSVCEHCASGCEQRTDHRRGKVLRRLAGDDPEVNEEWNCDKGRWAFAYTREPDRIVSPLVRGDDGVLHPASWPHALYTAAAGLAASGARSGVLLGGRCTVEDAYAYGKFARVVLGTSDVDFRARAHSGEEAQFLAEHVAGTGLGVTYADLETAPIVVLAGLEPEEESPIVFLRLRKSVRARGQRVHTIAPWRSPGAQKLSATLHSCVPGHEADVLGSDEIRDLLATPGAVLAVGERLATSPGALTAAAATGAPIAWIPRRAGERGALDVGAAPGLLPAGRPVRSERARADIAEIWGVDVPAETGRSTSQILDALIGGDLDGVVVGGVELDDLPDPERAAHALGSAKFVVCLEQRSSDATRHADVVFPVAAAPEKSGTYLDWEGRPRPFATALSVEAGSVPLSDHRVLHALADQIGVDLGCDTAEDIHAEFARIGAWRGERHASAPPTPVDRPAAGPGQAVLASWRMLLDLGRMQDGEPHLAGTAHPTVLRLSSTTAASVDAGDGDDVRVSTARGSITLPLVITDMPDGVVWVPMNSVDSRVHATLGATPGDVVEIGAAR